MPTYKVRIKPGLHYGVARHEGGDVIEVTEAEVRAFGDKFEIIGTVPDAEPQPEPTPDEIAEIAKAQADAIVARLEAVFGERAVEEKVEPQELAELQRRMRKGDVPKVEEVIGPYLAGKLDAVGLGDPIMVFYATDGDLTAVNGIGVGTLRRLRDVYGKAK